LRLQLHHSLEPFIKKRKYYCVCFEFLVFFIFYFCLKTLFFFYYFLIYLQYSFCFLSNRGKLFIHEINLNLFQNFGTEWIVSYFTRRL
jgi:hypothetical protein